MNNRFRKALLDLSPTFGAWMQIGHPTPAEIFGRLGFDWICVDLEHGAIDLETMTGIFRAIEGTGATPVARLPFADTIWIKRTLDAGAGGLIIPMVNSPEIARKAVREAKYPPRGGRGFGYSRANSHGLDFERSIRVANSDVALVVQIEHRDGIDSIDEILDIEGVDGAFIGPLDLSGSYGKPGDLECAEVTEALLGFRRSCQSHAKAAGMHIVQPDAGNIEAAMASGYTMVALGLDNVFLAAGARSAIQHARAAVGAPVGML